MEERYIADDQFAAMVKAMGAALVNEEGRMRWLVTTDEGEKFYLRPESARNPS